MSKKTYFLIILALILSGLFFFIQKNNFAAVFSFFEADFKIQLVCFEKICYRVELAQTAKQQARGLMARSKLGEQSGMLFVFEQEDFYSFWMKNTQITLDIIWINEAGKVVDIFENASPCAQNCEQIASGEKAKYVLEINGGQVEKNKIKIGDKITRRI